MGGDFHLSSLFQFSVVFCHQGISPKPKTLPKVLSGTAGRCVLGTEACPGLLGRRGFHKHLTFGVKL